MLMVQKEQGVGSERSKEVLFHGMKKMTGWANSTVHPALLLWMAIP